MTKSFYDVPEPSQIPEGLNETQIEEFKQGYRLGYFEPQILLKRELIIRIFRTRRLDVPEYIENHINRVSDLEQLNRMFDIAIDAEHSQEVYYC